MFRDTPALWSAADTIAQADGVVVATPVYKASYTGLLKAFLDLLPENALAGKVVLPLVTGGTIGHLLAIDYALRPVLTALGADHVVQGRFLLDADIVRGDPGDAYLLPEAERRLTDRWRRSPTLWRLHAVRGWRGRPWRPLTRPDHPHQTRLPRPGRRPPP